jgi:hypothetical protein
VRTGVNRFYNSIENAAQLTDKEAVGFFLYYLTVEMGAEASGAIAIDQCFKECDLAVPARTSAYLSEGTAAGRYVKADRGYKLQRHYREELSQQMGAEKVVAQANVELRRLEHKITTPSTSDFLKETIDCFEAGANRATIVMCWILAVDHLIEYVLTHRLTEFNAVLANNTDKRVKVTRIVSRDDFSDIPEGKLVEFLRAAGVISNDVRKILEEKLGTRNSCAHPSGVAIKPSKVIDFVDDLVENIVLKYKI